MVISFRFKLVILLIVTKEKLAVREAVVTEERIVYEDDHLIVLHRHLGSTLIISFNERGYRSIKECWGSKVFLSLGLSSLGYVSKKPNWFPLDSVKRSLAAVGGIIDSYSCRVTYGHSQGGYASLKYSACLKADAVLSFCPQFSIDPDDLDNIDNRFKRYFTDKRQHAKISFEDVSTKANVYIFYDPSSKLDRFNLNKITDAVSFLIPVKVFGTDHSSIRPFANREAFSELVRMSAIGDTVGIKELSRARKKLWRERPAFLARSLAESKLDTAIKVLSGKHNLLSEETSPLIVHFLAEKGRYEYLSRHAFDFMPFVQEKEARHLYRALLATDDIKGAIRFSSDYFVRRGIRLMSDDLVPKQLYAECSWVFFCEGWSGYERYGIWAVSKRSRLIIDWAKVPDSCKLLRIKFSQVLEGRIHISAKAFSGSKDMNLSFDSAGQVVITREGRIIEVEFYSDYLICPYAEGVGKDYRYLGVTLTSPKSWLS